MGHIQKLVPTATVLVDEAEQETYAKRMNATTELVTHPGLTSIMQIRNFALNHFSEDCIVMIDDDLKNVTSIRTQKRTMDPEIILQIIENPEAFSVITSVTRKEPGRPKVATLAITAPSQTGGNTLHMRRSGTNLDDPRQGRLSTEDGREIDQDTGKAATE